MKKNLLFKLVSICVAYTVLMSCMVFPTFAADGLVGIYDGTSLLDLSYTTSNSTQITIAENVFGKAQDDSVYAFTTLDSTATSESSSIQPLPVNNDYKPLVYEFQFMLPQGETVIAGAAVITDREGVGNFNFIHKRDPFGKFFSIVIAFVENYNPRRREGEGWDLKKL